MAKLTGRQKLLAKLEKIQGAPRVAMAAALEKGAMQIVASQKAFAPVKTGKLKDSITYTKGSFTLLPSQMATSAPVRTKRKGPRQIVGDADLTITVTAGDDKAWYARLVEFGTPPHANANGSHNPGASPHPFFFPGYRLNKRGVKSRVTRATRKAVQDGAR